MKKTVLFLDEVCPKPYDTSTLNGMGQGGTETTVTEIAEALAATRLLNVDVEQHCRTTDDRMGPNEVRYRPIGTTDKADYVICLRTPQTLRNARARFPNARIYLWSHDLASPQLFNDLKVFEETGTAANLVVSNFHKHQTVEVLNKVGYTGRIICKTVYNPIPDSLKHDGTEYDRNQLCFISSPHKGLDYALAIFEHLRKFNGKFTLHVTNPGYYVGSNSEQTGVVYHGSLHRSEVISILRKSLCLFYPNICFPETFGKVIAESDAVGTPVLTHQFGAAQEVADHPAEVMDCRDAQAVANKVMEWYNGSRPCVRAKPQFRLSRVLQTWIREVLA